MLDISHTLSPFNPETGQRKKLRLREVKNYPSFQKEPNLKPNLADSKVQDMKEAWPDEL